MARQRAIEDEQRRQFRIARKEFEDEDEAARVAMERASEVLAARALERRQQALLESRGGEA